MLAEVPAHIGSAEIAEVAAASTERAAAPRCAGYVLIAQAPPGAPGNQDARARAAPTTAHAGSLRRWQPAARRDAPWAATRRPVDTTARHQAPAARPEARARVGQPAAAQRSRRRAPLGAAAPEGA